MSEKIKYETILPEAIIEVKISGGFYKRLTEALLMISETKTPDDFKDSLEKIKENIAPRDPSEACIHALLPLIYAIETSAKEQGKITMQEFDPGSIPEDQKE